MGPKTFLQQLDTPFTADFQNHSFVDACHSDVAGGNIVQVRIYIGVCYIHVEVFHFNAVAQFVDGLVQVGLRQFS